MSEKKGFPSGPQNVAPSAPMEASEYFPHRGPPPSYEESQRDVVVSRKAPPPSYLTSVNQMNGGGNNMHNQNFFPQMYSQQQYYSNQSSFATYHQQPHPNMTFMSNQNPINNYPLRQGAGGMVIQGPNVVEFDACARFNGRPSGSVTVPPPPPGCAPTPAQLAALQGQPVILTKKKKSFF